MTTLLPRFANAIAAAGLAEINADPTLGGKLTLATSGRLAVTYAPFDHVNGAARVVLVGITPGRQQAVNALVEARRQLQLGRPLDVAAKAAKETASFSGSMRSALTDMLDHIGIARWLGIGSCKDLFGSHADLLHSTSALRYPVFLDGANYSGNPPMTGVPLLRAQIEEHLALEAKQLAKAVWIPLGPAPASALDLLVRTGALDRSRVLSGLPHPSGANGERIAYFLGRKERELLSAKTNAAMLDTARASLMETVRRLPAA
jgi:hypothetical protein